VTVSLLSADKLADHMTGVVLSLKNFYHVFFQ